MELSLILLKVPFQLRILPIKIGNILLQRSHSPGHLYFILILNSSL